MPIIKYEDPDKFYEALTLSLKCIKHHQLRMDWQSSPDLPLDIQASLNFPCKLSVQAFGSGQ